jgi:hypothetical protein
MTMPQLAAVQEEVVAAGGGGTAGAAGIDVGDMYDDIPPPHALKVAINKVHAAAGNQRH